MIDIEYEDKKAAENHLKQPIKAPDNTVHLNINNKEIHNKIRIFRQVQSVFQKRLKSWRKAELCCNSWNVGYVEGGRDECKVFLKYLETRIKKLEKQLNTKKGG